MSGFNEEWIFALNINLDNNISLTCIALNMKGTISSTILEFNQLALIVIQKKALLNPTESVGISTSSGIDVGGNNFTNGCRIGEALLVNSK